MDYIINLVNFYSEVRHLVEPPAIIRLNFLYHRLYKVCQFFIAVWAGPVPIL
jgi:hypothetical protein